MLPNWCPIFHKMKHNREDVWKQLIEAETSVEYFNFISKACTWINIFVGITLVLSNIGTLASAIATSPISIWVAAVGVIAAIIECFIKPFFDWQGKCSEAKKLRNDWIDVREAYEALWRKVRNRDDEVEVNVKEVYDKVIALEKKNCQYPQPQWLINSFCTKVQNRRAGTNAFPPA